MITAPHDSDPYNSYKRRDGTTVLLSLWSNCREIFLDQLSLNAAQLELRPLI